MSDTKKGILSKIFGSKKSGCCDLKIEEVPAQQEQNAAPKTSATKPSGSPPPSCCCGSQPKQSGR